MNKKSYVAVMFVFALAFFAVVTGGCGGGSSSYDEAVHELDDIGEPPVAPEEPFIENEEIDSQNPEFWISRLENPDEVIMDEVAIGYFNLMMSDCTGKDYLYSLEEIPEAELSDYAAWEFRIDGELVDQIALKEKIESNRFKFPELRYGIVVDHADLRFCPVSGYAEVAGYNDDFFQLGTFDVNEPFIISEVCTVNGETWYYGHGGYCVGWIKASNVAVCSSKEEWFEALFFDAIAVLTDDIDLMHCHLCMGTKLKLADVQAVPDESMEKDFPYIAAYIPVANKDGSYGEELVYLPKRIANVGFLPFTQRNILKLAFSKVGYAVYDSGDGGSLANGSLVKQVFACFGFEFPTIPAAHTLIDAYTDLFSVGTEAYPTIVENLPVGTILYVGDTNVIYIGTVGGVSYGIAGIDSETDDVHEVCVIDLNEPYNDGLPWYYFMNGYIAF